MREVEVAGVATTSFGKHLDRTLASLTGEAVALALADAALTPDDVHRVVFSNAAAGVLSGQEMIRGQVALKGAGLEGLPLVNIENACASGGSAAHLAWLSVASGQAEVVIVVGAEKLFHEDKQRSFDAIESGTDRSVPPAPTGGGSVMMGAYGAEARGYATEHHVDVATALAAVAVKNRAFAAQTPHAQFRSPLAVDDLEASRMIADPLRLLTCSPLTDGAAAIVLRAADAPPSAHRPRVVIRATELASHDPRQPVVARVVKQVYDRTGTTVADVDVFQLHDACAFAELQQYEQVGIAALGAATDAVLSGRTAAGGDAPVNTDGGLLSRGHPLGATGITQLAELTLQLQGRRGSAGPRRATWAGRQRRRVDGARLRRRDRVPARVRAGDLSSRESGLRCP